MSEEVLNVFVSQKEFDDVQYCMSVSVGVSGCMCECKYAFLSMLV